MPAWRSALDSHHAHTWDGSLADQFCHGPAQESSAKRHANGTGPAVFYRVLCPAQRIGNVIGKVCLRGLIM